MGSEQLRNLLRKEAESLSNEAVQSGGQISDDKVDTLERLALIVEICDQTKPQTPRKRWPVVIILGITLLAAMVLLSISIPKTEIELELTLKEMGFELSKPIILADAMVLSALGASNLREVQLARARSLTGQAVAAKTMSTPSDPGSLLRLSVVEEGDQKGLITLTALLLPAGTRVLVSGTEIPDQYRLSLEVPEKTQLSLNLSVQGAINVVHPGDPPEQRVYSIPGSIQMQAASNQVTLDLKLPQGATAAFAPHLPAHNLVFIRVDQFMDTTSTYVRRVSTVLSGKLYLTAFKGQEYPLRTGEGLQFEHSDGQIRMLTMENGQLTMGFHGNVRGMTIGWEESRKSLMPSWLEWLSARHGLTLLWGTTLYLFGLVLGVLKWWRRKTE